MFLFPLEIQAWRWREPRTVLQPRTASSGVWTRTAPNSKRNFKSSILLWHDVTFVNKQTFTQQEQMTSCCCSQRKNTTLLRSHVILLRFAFYVSSFLIHKLNVVCKSFSFSFYRGNERYSRKNIVAPEDSPSLSIQSKDRASTPEYSEVLRALDVAKRLLRQGPRVSDQFPSGNGAQFPEYNVRALNITGHKCFMCSKERIALVL